MVPLSKIDALTNHNATKADWCGIQFVSDRLYQIFSRMFLKKFLTLNRFFCVMSQSDFLQCDTCTSVKISVVMNFRDKYDSSYFTSTSIFLFMYCLYSTLSYYCFYMYNIASIFLVVFACYCD